MAYKSKCKEVSCCCIKIIRDVENEVAIDELVIENQEEKKDIG